MQHGHKWYITNRAKSHSKWHEYWVYAVFSNNFSLFSFFIKCIFIQVLLLSFCTHVAAGNVSFNTWIIHAVTILHCSFLIKIYFTFPPLPWQSSRENLQTFYILWSLHVPNWYQGYMRTWELKQLPKNFVLVFCRLLIFSFFSIY